MDTDNNQLSPIFPYEILCMIGDNLNYWNLLNFSLVNSDINKLLEKTRMSKKFEIFRECNSIAAGLYLKNIVFYEFNGYPMSEYLSLSDVLGVREYYFHCTRCGKEIEAEDYIEDNFMDSEQIKNIFENGEVICDTCEKFDDL